jgi:4-hydroxybenzoate polyprenyltransferase/phosphoserine phosphatase
MASDGATCSRVLVCDLDNSLIKTDLLFEGLLQFIKQSPLKLHLLIKAACSPAPTSEGADGGVRARIKQLLVEQIEFNPESLPYNDEVLHRIKLEKYAGSHIVLASASHQSWVTSVADHLGLFDEAHGTSAALNLKGKNKLAFMRRRFPLDKTTYIGDSKVDLPIWKAVATSVVVNPSRAMTRILNASHIAHQSLGKPVPFLQSLSKAIRVHQWAKNVLLFVPLIMAHRILDLTAWSNAVIGFFAFSFLASLVYVLNDLLDLSADRAHPKKRHRPFASGALSITTGLALLPVLLGLAFALAFQLPVYFGLTLLGYFLLNLGYSFRLKKTYSLDVVLLASMYTIRIFSGGAATAILVSDWLLAFSTFFFFGLAVLKRFTEVAKMVARRSVSGRGYLSDDKQTLLTLGICSSLLSTVILALYLNSPQVAGLYSHPQHLWLVLPIMLFWNSRLWIQANRNEVDSDPVVHALRDKISYFALLAILAVMLLSH